MRIGITGGSGFIGKELISFFLEKGHAVVVFTRSSPPPKSRDKKLTYVTWNPSRQEVPDSLSAFDVIINLAGATINKRWTNAYKKNILKSRVDAAQTILHIIKQQESPLPLLINASAVGYYGTSLTEVFTEQDVRPPSDFLSKVVTEWEASLKPCQTFCKRVIPIRFGLVLGKEEGAFPKMVLPYRFFIGGRIGSGKQWVSWIHIQDLVRLIDFVITDEEISGPVNATSPNPVQMNEFGKTIGEVLHRPHVIPIPEFSLKLLFGEMSELLLKGQNVMPHKALEHGFTFLYTNLQEAAKDLIISI